MKLLLSVCVLVSLFIMSSFSTPENQSISYAKPEVATIKPFGNAKMWSPTSTTNCIPITWDIMFPNNEPYIVAGFLKFVAGSFYIKYSSYVPAYMLQDVWNTCIIYDGDWNTCLTKIYEIGDMCGANVETAGWAGWCTYWE